MQNIDTGKMERITEEEHRQFEDLRSRLATAIDCAEGEAPPPSFQQGEVLTIRGGRFKVQAIRRGGLVLKGLPK